jgi:hypothetical protein
MIPVSVVAVKLVFMLSVVIPLFGNVDCANGVESPILPPGVVD